MYLVLLFRGNKLNAFAKGGEILLDPEWVRLADYLQNEWPELLTELIDLVTPPDEKRLSCSAASMKSYENFQCANKSDVGALSQRAQKWLSDTTNAIENAGGSLLDQVKYFLLSDFFQLNAVGFFHCFALMTLISGLGSVDHQIQSI